MSDKMDEIIAAKGDVLKRIIGIWSSVASVPKPSVGRIVETNKTSVTIESIWEFQDLQRRKMVSTTRAYVVKDISENINVSRVIHETSVSFTGYHPTSGMRVTIKSEGDTQYFELWDKTKRKFFMNVSDAKDHGLINTKSRIPFQWYKNQLLYLAKAKKKKDASFFKHPLESPEFELSTNMAHEFDYEDDWGETTSNYHLLLCIMDMETYKVTTENLKMKVSIGGVLWAPDGSVVFVGYDEEPYCLGQAACLNRKSAIYRYDVSSKATELLVDPPKESNHIRSARFDPNGKFLVYLRNSSNGCHQKCSQLMLFDWLTKEQRIVVDIVKSPGADDFPGIFASSLPERCFSSDSSHMFFTTLWHEKQKIVGVDLGHGHVFDITPDCKNCTAVLDVHDDKMIISCEDINEEPYFKLGQLQFIDGKVNVKCYNLDVDAPMYVASMDSSVLSYAPQIENSSYANLCHILFHIPQYSVKDSQHPVKDSQHPLIVWIHGGPHSCFTSQYNPIANGFVKMGFAVAMINYRGSTGYGEDYINSLVGKIGSQDISDVKLAISHTKEHMQKLGFPTNDVFIFGGSHGGFLGAHLSTQCPGEFNACALRNPVTNIATMAEISDIPDWSFSESGLEFNFESPTLEQRCLMYSKSPIKDVKQVTTPTLLLLGKKDRRVPYYQGLNYYKNLKKNNVEVKLCVYDDDGHALKGVAASSDGFVQTAVWFLSHMPSEDEKQPREDGDKLPCEK